MKGPISIKDSGADIEEVDRQSSIGGDYADNSSCKTGATGLITMKAFRPEILYEELNVINDAMTTITRPPVVEEVSQLKSNVSLASNDNIEIKSGSLTSMAGEFRANMLQSNFAPT